MKEYSLALRRLAEGRPIVLPVGSEINKKNVALEAGKDPSAIKSGREVFKSLIAEIESEHKKQNTHKYKEAEKKRKSLDRLAKVTAERDQLKRELAESRKECLMLLRELFTIKKQQYHAKPVKPDISPKN